MKIIFRIAILSAIALIAPWSAYAQVAEHTFKFAFVNEKDHPHGLGAQRFADLVSKKSDGKMSVKLFPSGTLGGDNVVLSSLQGGTIDISLMATGVLTGHFKEFSIFDFPFIFQNYSEADKVLDGPFGKKMIDLLPQKNMVGLSYWDHGYRQIINSKRPIKSVDDIKGLKIRAPQIPLYIDMFSALGANPTPMPWPEVYSALENGAIDGLENPLPSMESSKMYEVQKYLTLSRHMYNPLIVLFSKKIWDKLSSQERNILVSAAEEAKPYERQVSREMDGKALEIMKSKGIVVNELSAVETEKMRQRTKPVVDKYAKLAGEPLVNELRSEIERIRAGK